MRLNYVLDVRMSDDFEKTWLYTSRGEKQRGSQFDYSDQAILVMLTVKEVFHLTNRGVEGFVRSLFRMMKINLPMPDHSTLSKRGKDLKLNLPKKTSQSLNIVLDSTGLKIYGEGEWKVRWKMGRNKMQAPSRRFYLRKLCACGNLRGVYR
jgi:hypothetical protein